MIKRKAITIFWLLLVGFILNNYELEAANWYIDKDAYGANNGTTWSNAWNSFNRVIWGNGGVKAGDTLYISGGFETKIYTEKLLIGASGLPGSPITIRIGQDEGHRGNVILDYAGSGDYGSGSGIGLAGRNYISISGNYNGERKLKIQNLRNISDRMQGSGIGGVGTTASNIIIEYVEIYNCNNGIYFSYPTNVEIRKSKITSRGDTGIGLVTSTGTWDFNRVHNNEIISMVSDGGPDGISCSSGVSIYNNTFRVEQVSFKTSNQHPDHIQCTGNYVKVYNNDFIDIGDSAFDFDTWSNTGPNNIWIYNNVFRIVTAIDPYPDFIRLYTSNGKMSSVTNFKIFNNLFIDNNAGGKKWPTIKFNTLAGVQGYGNEIKNNIFFNCGDGSQYFPLIQIDGPAQSFQFDGNIYYHPSGNSYVQVYGGIYNAKEWVRYNEPKGKTESPNFIYYRNYDLKNDLRLADNDIVAVNSGVDFSQYTKTDKNGVERLNGFDIGPYEKADESGPNPPVGLRIIKLE